MATVAQLLAAARAQRLTRLDADLLLLHALGVEPARWSHGRGWLLAHDTDPVEAQVAQAFHRLVERRQHGEPLAYITGHKEFFGLDLRVDARALVPRPETEILVEWALECIDTQHRAGTDATPRVLDLGTGSGAIALALKHHRPPIDVDAVDASGLALALARNNAAHLGLDVRWIEGSWYEPLVKRYHCIVANPPYVREGDPHLEALRHEPISALTSGADGLLDIRQIVGGAAHRLLPAGWLLLEHGYDQGAQVCELMRAAGLRNVTARQDLAGQWRCSGGQMDPQEAGPTDVAASEHPGR